MLGTLIGLGAMSGRAYAWDWDKTYESELGYQGAMMLDNGHELSRNRPYAMFSHVSTWTDDDSPVVWRARAGIRGWLDFADDHQAEVRELTVERASDHLVINLGIQQVAWGETFGVPIVDLVNPRDMRDPLFYEMNWIRKPLPMANIQVLFGSLRLQGIASPLPRQTDLPRRDGPFSLFPSEVDRFKLEGPRDFPLKRFGQDGEYGGRVSYLFDSIGVDLSALYLYHWNRLPAFQLVVDHGIRIAQVQERIHSVGLTASKAFESWVLRADTVLHVQQPWTDDKLGKVHRINHWQGILGADYTSENGWTLGGQVHGDIREDRELGWVSVLVKKGLWDDRVEPQLFAFVGVNNTDRWVQPRIDWHISDPFTLSLRADFAWAKANDDKGDLWPMDGHHRVMVWGYWRF